MDTDNRSGCRNIPNLRESIDSHEHEKYTIDSTE